jgi:predicted amidohydrolase YtcJ
MVIKAKKISLCLFSLVVMTACRNKLAEADLILTNAQIYSVDSVFSIHQALAIKDGKILAIGTNEYILKQFSSADTRDIKGKYIFPGIIDAHCHFYSYGKGLNEADLIGSKSFEEVLERTVTFAKMHDLYPGNKELAVNTIVTDKAGKRSEETNWIIGRGWDQNTWENKQFPDKAKLDVLFPSTPVILKRIDGHAVLVNEAALVAAGITEATKIKGGSIETYEKMYPAKQAGKKGLTGILIDNAIDLVTEKMPRPDKGQIERALLKAQANCFEMGITTVVDAGLEKTIVDAIDSLHKTLQLKMRVYAMLTPNKENLDHYLTRGIYITDKLSVRSFKFYGDGALGSRGACLLKDYADKAGWKGFLLNEAAYFKKHAELMIKAGFQMNSHCIGDSALRVILDIYTEVMSQGKKDNLNNLGDFRWRIEHAQIAAESDLKKFNKNIIPSVQPTHATSDMYWAETRLGKERIGTAYAYKQLLSEAKLLALGTDFPVEDISPFKTFYAAVYRKDAAGFPEGGFQMEGALSREQTLKGMTIWAAHANFEEKNRGSLETGKWADFAILDTDLMSCRENEILKTKVLSTFIAGEEVYKR